MLKIYELFYPAVWTAIIIIVMFSINASAYEFAEKWTMKDTAYQVAFLTVLMVDWAQTRTMAKNNWKIGNEQFRETCPFLSEHPTESAIDGYFLVCAVGHTIISMALKPEVKIFDYKINPRRVWQMVWIGIETGYAIKNYSVGVRIEF